VTLVATAAHATPGGSPATPRPRRPRPLWPYLFIAPACAALVFGFIYPLISVVRNSFYAGTVYELNFVGIGNFKTLFEDPIFRTSIANNLRLLLTVPVMTVLALAVAAILHSGVRGGVFYRAAVFLPYILPAAGIGLGFSVFLQFNGGLNQSLRAVGMGGLAYDWLGSPNLAIWSVGAVVVWQQLGFGVVVFLAALLSLPVEVTEAARMDGASWWRIQTRVHLPQIRGTIEFFVVLQAITVLSLVFTYVYILTTGGPSNSSSVMEFYIWRSGFAQGSVGLANAAAVVLLALAGVLIAIYMRLRLRDDDPALR
jgi:ABC-type sugar transport system permease subunit